MFDLLKLFHVTCWNDLTIFNFKHLILYLDLISQTKYFQLTNTFQLSAMPRQFETTTHPASASTSTFSSTKPEQSRAQKSSSTFWKNPESSTRTPTSGTTTSSTACWQACRQNTRPSSIWRMQLITNTSLG